MFKFAIKIPLYHGTGWTVYGSPLFPPEGTHIPLSVLSHCTMGQVGLSMGIHCPTNILLSVLSHCTVGQVGLSVGIHCPTLRTPISHCASYPTVPWDRLDCPWESTVSPEDLPKIHCLSYPTGPCDCPGKSTVPPEGTHPTVPLDRWDCPWEHTVPPKDPQKIHCLSYPTVPWDFSMGAHCST